MPYIPDNLDMFNLWDFKQNKRLSELPKCDYCDEPIQHDHYYLINDEFICPDCLDSYFRKENEF